MAHRQSSSVIVYTPESRLRHPIILFREMGRDLVGLGTGIGLWLSPLGALYQDIGRAIPLVMTPWLLLTPVIYPPPTTGWFSVLVNWNPVTPLLVTVRDLATVGTVSEPAGFWWASGLMVVLLLSGWLFYRLAMPFIVERMSS